MRVLRIVGWVVGAIILLIVAAGVAVWAAPGPIGRWAVAYPVSAMMGRQMRVAGPLSIHWGSPIRIVAEKVSLANASWGMAPQMFAAKRVVLVFYPWSLIRGPTRIVLVEADDASLLLETSKTGEKNWAFSNAAPKHRESFPVLQQLVLKQSQLTWHNGETDATTVIGADALSLDAPDPQGPVKIAGYGRFQKLAVRLSATVGPLAALRQSAKPYPLDIWADLGGMALTLDGTVAKPLDFSGLDLRLSLAGPSLDRLSEALSLPLPPLPEFRGTTKLRGGNGQWALQAFTMKLGKSDLEGGLDVNTNAKVPDITANLTSSYIDLADFTGAVGVKPKRSAEPTPAQPPDTSGRVIPDLPIAVKKLPGINAKVSFYGTRIRSSGGLPLERVALGLALENGILTVKPLRFHVASGDLALDFTFTPWVQQGAPRLEADLQISNVDLHQLFAGTGTPAMVKETRGIIGGFARVSTSGVSLRQFLARMDGEAGIFMENGAFSNLLQKLAPIDVLESLGVLIAGDRPVPIQCLVSHFNIKQGVATASTFLFDTQATEIVASGNINFASETLYLNLDPINKGPTPLSLRTPIRVRGTFKQPAFSVNPVNIIARLGAAVGLGILFPPAALVPLIDTGLGPRNACARAYAATGSSVPPKK